MTQKQFEKLIDAVDRANEIAFNAYLNGDDSAGEDELIQDAWLQHADLISGNPIGG